MLLLASTVSALQRLLNVCQCEQQYLDMAINAKKSVYTRFGPRYKQPCSSLLTSGGREIVWSENVRYLGVHMVSSKSFTCSLSNSKRSFYRSFDAIFGKVVHIASEAAIVELLNRKCLPTLLYGLEACPLKSADLKSLDYIVVGALMKIFKTKSKEVAICWIYMVNCPLPSVSVNNRRSKFLFKCSVSKNIVCRHCAECAK